MKSLKFNYAIIALLLPSVWLMAQHPRPHKDNVNDKPYPFQNPVIRHMYTADAAPKVMPDGKVWMVTSVDSDAGGGYETMHCYHTFSSADMVTWTDHGEVLNISDFEQVPGNDYALWAPDWVYHDGKYYLYFPMRIITAEKKHEAYIGVAVSDDPAKKFEVLNPKIEGTSGIDPAVFIDDNGEAYLYWGNRMVAKLKDNMYELATAPMKIDIGTENFMEAAWMHKHQGRYYLNYHTKYDWKVELNCNSIDDPKRAHSDLAYSIGNSPMGPLVYSGILNPEPGAGVADGPRHPDCDKVPWRFTLSNHGGVVEFHGQDYLFYHTSALSSWRQDEFKAEGTWTQRSVCVDSLNYTDNGDIIPVRQTIHGVAPVKVNQPFSIALSNKKIECSNGATLKFDSVNMGSGYYYFKTKVLKAVPKARIEIRRDSPVGILMGTIHLDSNSMAHNNGMAETYLREANGTHDIYLIIEVNDGDNLQLDEIQLFAGSPSPH